MGVNMNTNHQKNRGVCILAKGSVWGLRTLLALTLLLLGGFSIAGIVIKIRKDWDWTQFGQVLLSLLVFFLLGAFAWLIYWLFLKWYNWAKSYSRGC